MTIGNLPRACTPLSRVSTSAASIELTAVLVAVTGEEPRVLTIKDGKSLPSGPFASIHRSLQTGLRSWVERQTHHPLGYLEQLYTLADRDRKHDGVEERMISISYLGLTREARVTGEHGPGWQNWYRYFQWEDWRDGPPALVARSILPSWYWVWQESAVRWACQSGIWVTAESAAAMPGAAAMIGFPAVAPSPAMKGLTVAPASSSMVRAAATSHRLMCNST